MSYTLTINGAARQTAATTVTALLAEEGVKLDAKGVAVALNGAVVRKLEWSATALADGDTVEIVKPFSGG
jgi:sulfur carrier protein